MSRRIIERGSIRVTEQGDGNIEIGTRRGGLIRDDGNERRVIVERADIGDLCSALTELVLGVPS